MKLGQARILKAGAHDFEPALEAPTRTQPSRSSRHGTRRVPKETVEASENARRLLEEARSKAETMLNDARRRAAEIKLRAETEGRADGAAALAAQAIALRSRELRETERRLDELVELGRALAERLLGEELALAPERVIALARQALAEARGARQITIEAHPDDTRLLRDNLASLDVEADTVKLLSSPNRTPGDLKIVTEVGVLDASLAPQLERLALKLRESLGS